MYTFILLQTESIANSWNFERHSRFIRQKLASVASRKVLTKTFFSKFSIFQKIRKRIFIKTLREATEASFWRMELLGCSKYQEFAILSVWNKIKLSRSFYNVQKYQFYLVKTRFFVFCHRFWEILCSVKPLGAKIIGKKRCFCQCFVLFEKFCQKPIERTP